MIPLFVSIRDPPVSSPLSDEGKGGAAALLPSCSGVNVRSDRTRALKARSPNRSFLLALQ